MADKRYRAPNIDTRLHEATKKKDVISLLSQDPPVDVNGLNEEGNTALHCYINRRRSEGYPLLLCLLTNCDTDRIDLDTPGSLLNTPLHLAAQVGDIDAAKALIAFGADIDALNINQATPLDVAFNDEMRDLLFFVGSEAGDCVRQRLDNFKQLPPPAIVRTVSIDDGVDWRELSQSTDLTSLSSSIPASAMDNYSAWLRWREKQKTLQEQKKRRSSFRRRDHRSAPPPVFKAREGHRVLCLDGGGMRGLILIEVLSYIAQTSGRKITDLFEWIVATSTGAIVALGLAYADLNVQQVRQLYFEMKEKVFGKTRFGYCCDTEAKEELLKRVFGDRRMLPLDNGPKILISTVDKTTDKLELNWFSNFREDDKTLYGRPLWEVARATAAAPGFFSPLKQCIDGREREFIDGGLRANNPSESGLTIIQDYLRQCSERGAGHKRVSLVVSIGCGDFPGKELGDLDLEKYLFPGKNFPWLPSIIKTFKNLMTMFIHAIDNSEGAASNTRSRCQEQGVAFYRFNPKFDEEISLTETEDKILCNMIISARVHIISKLTHMEEIIQSFYEENQ